MKKAVKKGICKIKKKFYGLVTITERGQVVISKDIRDDLGIKNGDKLLMIKRDDGKGINLMKAELIDEFINQVSKD